MTSTGKSAKFSLQKNDIAYLNGERALKFRNLGKFFARFKESAYANRIHSRSLTNVHSYQSAILYSQLTQPKCIMYQYCENGDLLDYLLRQDKYEISKFERLRFVEEVLCVNRFK